MDFPGDLYQNPYHEFFKNGNTREAVAIDRIGFACVTYGLGLTTNHTLRLANLPSDRFKEALRSNIRDLEAILSWMEPRGLRLFRIGSSMVPFASHQAMTWAWEPMAAMDLARIGQIFRTKGFRFSMHPGQYNVLNSAAPEVVERTVAELAYSCRVLELMGCDPSHKVILHGGCTTGGKEAATERLVQNILALPGRLRSRLALENDERFFDFADIVDICRRAAVSPLFDIHHHTLNPCRNVSARLADAEPLWDSRPKVHLSSSKPGARSGAHDLFVRKEDLEELLALLPFDADCMVEAKAKEEAALRVARDLETPRVHP